MEGAQNDGRLRRTEFDRLLLEADASQPVMELDRLWQEGVRNSLQKQVMDATGRFTVRGLGVMVCSIWATTATMTFMHGLFQVTLPGLFAVADATNVLRYAYRREFVPEATDDLCPPAAMTVEILEERLVDAPQAGAGVSVAAAGSVGDALKDVGAWSLMDTATPSPHPLTPHVPSAKDSASGEERFPTPSSHAGLLNTPTASETSRVAAEASTATTAAPSPQHSETIDGQSHRPDKDAASDEANPHALLPPAEHASSDRQQSSSAATNLNGDTGDTGHHSPDGTSTDSVAEENGRRGAESESPPIRAVRGADLLILEAAGESPRSLGGNFVASRDDGSTAPRLQAQDRFPSVSATLNDTKRTTDVGKNDEST